MYKHKPQRPIVKYRTGSENRKLTPISMLGFSPETNLRGSS